MGSGDPLKGVFLVQTSNCSYVSRVRKELTEKQAFRMHILRTQISCHRNLS